MEQLIDLRITNFFFEFRTRSVEQFLPIPVRDDCWNCGIDVSFALFVEHVTAISQVADANPTDHNQREKNNSESYKKFPHCGSQSRRTNNLKRSLKQNGLENQSC